MIDVEKEKREEEEKEEEEEERIDGREGEKRGGVIWVC